MILTYSITVCDWNILITHFVIFSPSVWSTRQPSRVTRPLGQRGSRRDHLLDPWHHRLRDLQQQRPHILRLWPDFWKERSALFIRSGSNLWQILPQLSECVTGNAIINLIIYTWVSKELTFPACIASTLSFEQESVVGRFVCSLSRSLWKLYHWNFPIFRPL